MKTITTFLRWAVCTIGVILSITIALIPSGIYAFGWYVVPKTFLPVLALTTFGGIVWFVFQIGCVVAVIVWAGHILPFSTFGNPRRLNRH